MIKLNKELVYKNIFDLINNGYFLDKYIELTTESINNDIEDEYNYWKDIIDDKKESVFAKTKDLEETASKIFNAIIIGCQLFDDQERIKKFVDMFSSYLDPYYLERCLPEYSIKKEEAINRLNHGFVVHFTTPKIGEIIKRTGKLVGSGTNVMFREEEDKIINYAKEEQIKNNPLAEETLNYLFRGWGTGVSSYGSTTNGFWMYHTPESLTFLFGDISKRDKDSAMNFVSEKISSLKEEDKKLVFNMMSNIYDRLIGNEQNTCCILIDRDAFKYEVDYYYETEIPKVVERRPFSTNFNSLKSNDSLINEDVDVKYLQFIKIPTIIELERQKNERIMNNNSSHRL